MLEDEAHGGSGGRRWRDDLAVLRRRDVALLVAARFVSEFGSGLAPIALAFGVLSLPGADASSLGLVLLCATVPRLMVILFGGVLADRVRRSRLMVTADILAGLAQLCAGLLFLSGNAAVARIAALAVVNGVAVALFVPSLTGLIPQVAGQDGLQSVNALARLAGNTARILGTLCGGVLVAVVGAGWALVVDSATFAASAVLLFMIRSGAAPTRAASSLLTDLRDGWQEFTARRWVWLIVMLFSLSSMGFQATVFVLGPVRAVDSWGGARGWALITASFFAGTAIGVVAALRVRPSRPLRLAMTAQLFVALPVIGLAPPLPLVVVAVFAFISGLCIDVFEVLWQTTLQENIPAASLSRVSSYDWLGSIALTPIAMATVGGLVAAVGLETSLWICAALTAVTGLALLDPQVRALPAGGRPSAAGRSSA